MKVGKLPQEANQHSRLNEERIKTLTGGDEVTARFLHKEFFTFRPTVKLVLAVNHKPVIQDDSFGMWRRVRVIPFTQQFRIDKTLETTLVDEADLVDGLGRLGSSGHTLGTPHPLLLPSPRARYPTSRLWANDRAWVECAGQEMGGRP